MHLINGIYGFLQWGGKWRKKKSKTYDAYKAAMAARAEAAVDIDVPNVVVADAVVEVPPRSGV